MSCADNHGRALRALRALQELAWKMPEKMPENNLVTPCAPENWLRFVM
jgi:hypothetical protein